MLFRRLLIAAAVSAAAAGSAMACTTILVDRGASADGSFFIARSVDGHVNVAQWMVRHPAVKGQKGEYRPKALSEDANDFAWPLPENALAYSSTPSWMKGVSDPKLFNDGAAGFNELGVGISGTESIYASPEALKADPYNEASGISEMDITNVLLPRARSAREGAQILGSIIEKAGAAEGMGVAFVDEKELWYLETGSGHQWMARRIPKAQYFASGNQSRLQEYRENDPDFMGSKTLVSFAEKHGLYSPKDGAFNFTKAYARNDARDRTYNDPRVWAIQRAFTPSLEQKIDEGRSFPVFAKPERKLTLDDLRTIMRNHYQGLAFDPYTNGLKPDSKYRPISVFRAFQTHILQVRPGMPKAIGEVHWLSLGMADLSVFVPFYQGIGTVPQSYSTGTDRADSASSFWKIRKLQGIVMTDYPKLAPIVQKAFRGFEAETAERQKAMEAQYLKTVKSDPKGAQKLLDGFSADTLARADALADRLTDEVMTERINDIEAFIPFNNRKKPD